MQTFLPYPDFHASARVLDDKRLGKQRVEVLQILKALLDATGWSNHPATKMWLGHENSLVEYGITICNEWRKRGFKDTCADQIAEFLDEHDDFSKPGWFGNTEFHRSHQSNLVRKLPEHYARYFPDVPVNLPYVWPKPSLMGTLLLIDVPRRVSQQEKSQSESPSE